MTVSSSVKGTTIKCHLLLLKINTSWSQQIFLKVYCSGISSNFFLTGKWKRETNHILRKLLKFQQELDWRYIVKGWSWTWPPFINLKTTGFKSCIYVEVSLTFWKKVINKWKCIYANCFLSVKSFLSVLVLSEGSGAVRRTGQWCLSLWPHSRSLKAKPCPLLMADPPPENKMKSLFLYISD